MKYIEASVRLYPYYEEPEEADPAHGLQASIGGCGITLRVGNDEVELTPNQIRELNLEAELWGYIFKERQERKELAKARGMI